MTVVDVGIGTLRLRAAGIERVQIDQRVTGGTLDKTIDGASTLTLTLDDSDRVLIRSGVFERSIDVKLDEVFWRLVKVAKAGDSLTLTFEDRAVAWLREMTSPRKASRTKMTRAEFALSIVREVKKGGGIPFFCPELHVTQKVAIESKRDKVSPTKRKQTVAGGVARDARVTVKGRAATSAQRQTGERVLDVAASLDAGERATLALMEAVIVESLVTNLPGGDLDSRGVLQIRDQTAQSMRIDNRDVEQCVNAFLTRGFWSKGGAIALAAKNPSWTAGQVAQATQGSRYPSRYDDRRNEARIWIEAYSGDLGSGSFTSTKRLPFQFQRGGTDGVVETSWECLQRLAEEVGWRCFVVGGVCYFAAETTLLAAKPRAVLSENSDGVDVIDFDVDNGKASSDATITARVARSGFPPGSVVELRDCGPADGRWLVANVSRGVFDASATVTLKRATKPLREPAAETQTTTLTGGSIGSSRAIASGRSPKEIIDEVCVPLAQQHAMVTGASAEAIAAANARHGATVSGSRSDHQGPPTLAWAADMSNGSQPTRQMDGLAADLAKTFGIPWTGSGLVTKTSGAYRLQLIYRTSEGGNHFNHVHFGVRRTERA